MGGRIPRAAHPLLRVRAADARKGASAAACDTKQDKSMPISIRFLLVFLAVILTPLTAVARQDWRTAAEERIELYRKAPLRVVVQDQHGRPLAGVPVHAAMQRHAFGFGTAVSSAMLDNTREPIYRDKVEDVTGDGRTFNLAVFENAMKWPQWEANTVKSTVTDQVLWLNSRGMDVRGHNLVWPAFQWLPADIEANENDPDYVRERIKARIFDMAGYRGIKGSIVDWDVVNEPAHLFDVRDIFAGQPEYPTGEEIYAEMFQWAAEADPNARLYVNEYNILNNYNGEASTRQRYKEIIENLIDAGAPLYGIGMQGHMSNPLTSPETIYQALEEFAVYGKALAVTEYDASGVGETTAADYLRDFLTVVFSHPSVESFTMWGFWDGAHWRDDAPLFRQDWSLKPSGEAFLDLVFDEWWTDETLTTDADGAATLRAFVGEYEVTADVDGGAITRDVTLAAGDTTEVVITVTITDTEAETGLPEQLTLAAGYPNPFHTATTLRYALPAPGPVRLEVFDPLGRTVARPVDAVQPAGWHELLFEAGTLPDGVYFFRLTAGAEQRVGRMLLVR